MNTEAVKLWKEKLAYLQREEAIASDPEQKFQLEKQIQECQQKLKSYKDMKWESYPEITGQNFFVFQTPKPLLRLSLR